ncbi:hypothetical protein PCH_Pc22g16650 [Penicillium rubens Wisconsin 54-1255]|uniref:Uncharacterized protein n=1 Tax=Penicillium rubens (strain ATCC 28089 / DSM 1075 / NRRL 1951 / Wisconsin 54-1255) TaxID=500485 RepID=B6HRJ8_PENRW|nr:hypothetical protein PCH_Pc22g16650 [Penicillium rubens Wisconsin 54-1255]
MKCPIAIAPGFLYVAPLFCTKPFNVDCSTEPDCADQTVLDRQSNCSARSYGLGSSSMLQCSHHKLQLPLSEYSRTARQELIHYSSRNSKALDPRPRKLPLCYIAFPTHQRNTELALPFSSNAAAFSPTTSFSLR